MNADSVAAFEKKLFDNNFIGASKLSAEKEILEFGYNFISTINSDGLNWDRYTIVCGRGLVEQRRFLQIGYDHSDIIRRIITDIPK